MMKLLTGSLFSALLLASSVSAQEDIFSDLLSCDPLVIPSERLACFDGILKQYKPKYDLPGNNAKSTNQYRVAEENRKSPSADKDIHATILDIKRAYTGHRTFTLSDGSQWRETDGSTFPDGDFRNRKVQIKQGFLGSWRLHIDGMTGFSRVKRVG